MYLHIQSNSLKLLATPKQAVQLCSVDGSIGLRVAAQSGLRVSGTRNVRVVLEDFLTKPEGRVCSPSLRGGAWVLHNQTIRNKKMKSMLGKQIFTTYSVLFLRCDFINMFLHPLSIQ